jgi:hypothetical protein
MKLQRGLALGQPFCTKCASIAKSCGEIAVLCLLAHLLQREMRARRRNSCMNLPV